MQLTGFKLLECVEAIDANFVSGAPWKGKEKVVEACGYIRRNADDQPKADYGAFHDAYEDARLFRDKYSDDVKNSENSPQGLFDAFIYVYHESFTIDVEDHVRLHGIDSVLELAEELREYELTGED